MQTLDNNIVEQRECENKRKRTDPLGLKHSEVLEYIFYSIADRMSVFPARHSSVPFPSRWARFPNRIINQYIGTKMCSIPLKEIKCVGTSM
jgi:hypothetical protein